MQVSKKTFFLLFGLTLAVITALVMFVAYNREAANRMTGRGRLSQIAGAFTNYFEHYGTFPPVVLLDDNGTPSHSWRLLIVKDDDDAKRELFGYDFRENWNSPKNLLASEKFCTDEFGIARRFQYPHAKKYYTSFVAVVNKDNNYEWLTPRNSEGQILLFISDRKSCIGVSEPKDITLDEFKRILEKQKSCEAVFWDLQTRKAVVKKVKWKDCTCSATSTGVVE